MHSSGIIKRAQAEIITSQETEQKFNPIPLRQLVVPFLILIIGVLAAPLILICELVLKRQPKQPNRQKRMIAVKYRPVKS